MKSSRTLALTAALLLPGSALAQTITVYINSSSTAATSGAAFPFHQEACEQALDGTLNNYNVFTMDWALDTTGETTYQAFWTTDPSCSTPGVGDGGDSNIPISSTGTQNQVTINAETILNQVTGSANPCTTPASNLPSGTVYICISGSETDEYATTGDLIVTPFDIEFDYDMNPPPASTAVSVTAADSELDCNWNFPYVAPPITTTDTAVITDTGDNADHFVIYAQEDDSLTPSYGGSCSEGDGGSGGDLDGGIIGASVDPTGWPIQVTVPTPSSTDNSASITGLTNGVCYDVSIIAFYPDGTQGYPTPVAAESPIEIWDYWRLYHAAGGADEGGLHCQSAGGGLIPLSLAAGLLLALRRRRRSQ